MLHPTFRRPARSDSDVPVLALLVIVLLLLLGGGGVTVLWTYRASQVRRAELIMMEMRAREAEEEARAQADLARLEVQRREKSMEEIRREKLKAPTAPLLERGLKLAGQGQVNQALLWFARGLEQSGDDAAMQRVFRHNLAAWGQPQADRKLFAQKGGVTALALSPDGKTILTGGEDGAAQAWALDGKPAGEVPPGEGKVSALAFDPGGKGWWVANAEQVRRIDPIRALPTGDRLDPPGPVLAFARGSGDKLLMFGTCGQGVWQCDDGGREGASRLFRPDSPVVSAALASDAKVILTTHEDHTTRLWGADGKPFGTLPGQDVGPSGVAVSADGKLLAVAAGQTARLWDASTRLPVGRPWAHEAEVLAVAFSADRKSLLSGDALGTVRQATVAAPLEGDAARIRLWVQVMARQELDVAGQVRPLNEAALKERRQKLQELGGPLTP
jgi:hypothetical protein